MITKFKQYENSLKSQPALLNDGDYVVFDETYDDKDEGVIYIVANKPYKVEKRTEDWYPRILCEDGRNYVFLDDKISYRKISQEEADIYLSAEKYNL